MPKRIAILATDGFEQSELMEPRRLLREAGFTQIQGRRTDAYLDALLAIKP